jgi:undecaprenyl diphosphate synthase
MDNTKRAKVQTKAFTQACIDAVEMISREDVSLLVVGNTETPMFPEELLPFTEERRIFGEGGMKVNFLVNYGWHWDLQNLIKNKELIRNDILESLNSNDISRIDLIVRWGDRRRLSGFLPVQSIYADIYVVDDYWPDFKSEHFYAALEWYDKQDLTYGG